MIVLYQKQSESKKIKNIKKYQGKCADIKSDLSAERGRKIKRENKIKERFKTLNLLKD